MSRWHARRGLPSNARPSTARAAWYDGSVETQTVPGAYLLDYEDWLDLPDEGRLCELIDGEIFLSPSPSVAHQRLTLTLAVSLRAHVQSTGQGEVFIAPLGVRLDERTVLEPDVFVVLREHAGRVGDQVIGGPPDLVVEVLSPGTARRDLGAKREKYRAHGVSEYWIVDPVGASIEVLVLEKEDYAHLGRFDRSQALHSRVLNGRVIALADVFPAA